MDGLFSSEEDGPLLSGYVPGDEYPEHMKTAGNTHAVPAQDTYLRNKSPSYGGRRLSTDDEKLLAEGLFKSEFNEDFLRKAERICADTYGVSLDAAYIFEMALSDVMATPAQVLENCHILGNVSGATKNEQYDKKREMLHDYIRRSAANSSFDDDTLYVGALKAIEKNGFDISKQSVVGRIFDALRDDGIVSETFDNIAKSNSRSKPQSLRDITNPAVSVYNAVLKSGFDKPFAEKALRWYSFCIGDDFSLGFYGSTIDQKDLIASASLALDSIRRSCMSGDIHPQIKESMDYIKYINKIKSARDFLKKAGFESDVVDKINAEVNPATAIKIMKQNILKHDDGLIETVLDAIEFLSGGNYELSNQVRKDYKLPEHEVRWILEAYLKPDHPIQKARKDQKKKRKRFTDDVTVQMPDAHGYFISRKPRYLESAETPHDALNSRLRRIYTDFGGSPKFGLSAAKLYELEKKERESMPKPAASPVFDSDAYLMEQRERMERREQEREARIEMEKNGFKGREFIFEVSGFTNQSKGVVNGHAVDRKLPYRIITKIPGAKVGEFFKVTVGKKHGTHYEATKIEKYNGPLEFKKSEMTEDDSW